MDKLMNHRAHLQAAQLLSLMEAKRYGVEYQPNVSMNSNEIFAYIPALFWREYKQMKWIFS